MDNFTYLVTTGPCIKFPPQSISVVYVYQENFLHFIQIFQIVSTKPFIALPDLLHATVSEAYSLFILLFGLPLISLTDLTRDFSVFLKQLFLLCV